jgi:hypothetical protein
MNEIVVHPPNISETPNAIDVSVPIELAGTQFDLWYRTTNGPVNLSAEPFLAATLIPAMKLGMPLHLNGSVSPKLSTELDRIQHVLHGFFPELHQTVIVTKPSQSPAEAPDRKVACFFSGGMDSFYTCLKHQDEIDMLIFVRGFDIRSTDEDVWDHIAPSIRAAAHELGKPLLEVSTNIQLLTDLHFNWVYTYGSAMASVALLLAPLFRKVYFASSGWTYKHLFPLGSHPLLDPLWSTEMVQIVHDGSEATKVDKAALVATSKTALKYLRVCTKNRNEDLKHVYNCGRCEKCLRTKTTLYLVGALDRCATFDHNLDLDAISRMIIHPPEVRVFVEDNLEAAERLHADPALIAALRESLQRSTPGVDSPSARAPVRDTARSLEQENVALRAAIQALYQSRSWRITWSIRALADIFRKLLRFSRRFLIL